MDPLYEYREDQPSFRILIIITGIMFLAMAVFLPWPEGTSPFMIWGMRVFFVVMAGVVFLFAPTIRVRAFSDHIEARYGPTSLITLILPKSDIIAIYPIEYNPMRDFGGWGVKGGVGKWAGWMAYTATMTNTALGIETTGKNYLIGCPNPEEAATMLKNTLGISQASQGSHHL